MKYYLIAGEASGDLHGANLMKALKKIDPDAVFRFWGGDKMLAQGGTLVKHYKDLAFMGFWEVVKHLRTIFKNLSFCKEDIRAFEPDVIVYIDYPGFNMRIAQWAKQEGYINHYYISPQIWAWKENRIHKIKRDIHQLYCILPFEKEYYEKKHRHAVQYVGNPLVEVVDAALAEKEDFIGEHNLDDKRPIVALLPGSRKQEILKMMPVFLDVATHFPKYQFVVAAAPGLDLSWYNQFSLAENITIVSGATYPLLKHAEAALVTSGTATLETALFGVPQMVCYKSSWISFAIAKRIIRLSYVSLVNLILDQKVVEELLQDECNVDRIKKELSVLFTPEKRKQIKNDYSRLRTQLGEVSASRTTALQIVQSIQD